MTSLPSCMRNVTQMEQQQKTVKNRIGEEEWADMSDVDMLERECITDIHVRETSERQHVEATVNALSREEVGRMSDCKICMRFSSKCYFCRCRYIMTFQSISIDM